MVKSEKNKVTYKLLLLTLRCIPILLSILNIVYSFAHCIGIELSIIFALSKMSLIAWIFMHLASIVFKFCIYHRSFLYYIFAVNWLNFHHYCCGIAFGDFNKVVLHFAIAGVILLIMLIIHVTNNKKASHGYYK